MIAYLLNLADLAFTIHATGHGAVELNPLMESQPFMVFYKIFVVGGCLWIIRGRRRAMRWMMAVYAAVNAWHIINLMIIWREAYGLA